MSPLPPGYSLKQGTGAKQDRVQLDRFLALAYGLEQTSLQPKHLADMVENFFDAHHTPLFVVIYRDLPVGCLWMGRATDQRNGTAQAYIFLVAVDPEHQRQGIGTCLLSKAQEQTQQWGLSELALQVYPDNQTALKLYEKLGFVVKSQLLALTLKPKD